MTHLFTRFETAAGHGWYVGTDAEIVLVPGEPEVWPGTYEAFCRRRGRSKVDLAFRTPEQEAEFFGDVRITRATRADVTRASARARAE